jgi:hypothetical protein
MPSERSFLRQRLALVERQLASPDPPFLYAGRGRVRWRKRSTNRLETRYTREARLLRKLLFRAEEGQALTALKGWRCKLGEYLANHRQRYKEMQDTYDDWWELPWYQRARVPKPPKPPPARYVDHDGALWIIDDRLLALLEDLTERLEKWLNQA